MNTLTEMSEQNNETNENIILSEMVESIESKFEILSKQIMDKLDDMTKRVGVLEGNVNQMFKQLSEERKL